MDKLDQKILQVLDFNGRMPASHIAKLVRSNKEVVLYRINKLEEQGIILRYFPVLDMSKLGYYTSRLYFDLEEMSQDEEKIFIEFLDREIHAGLIFRMDYPYRYGVVVWTKSIFDLEKIIVKIKHKLGKQLLRYNYTLFCTYTVFPKDYLFGKKIHQRNYCLQPQKLETYDHTDFLILHQLAKNARLSTVHIAQSLKIPQTTVSHKIKNMERKNIILGYRAEINFIKLGYTNYFLEIYLEDNHNLAQIEAWATTHQNTVWLQKIIGTCDIEIEVEVKDRVELESLLAELRTRFPNIRKIVFWSQEYKKLTFLP